MRSLGVRSAAPVDLLAVGFSRRESDVDGNERDARTLAERVVAHEFADLSAADIREAFGLEPFEILRSQALIELGRRSGTAKLGERDEIATAEEVARQLRNLRYEQREHFVAFFLDAKMNILRRSTIHIGTLTASLVGPREVFREAIREGACSVIVAHNHPSGDPTPSPEDLDVTERLVEIGKLLDIPVLDHVIIGQDKYVSLRDRGAIK